MSLSRSHAPPSRSQPDRFLCFFFRGNKIIVTNAFEKKRNKLPANEKRIALMSKKQYEMRLKEGKYYDQIDNV